METMISDSQKKEILLQMMDEFDSFCRKHNLKYILGYGTLLGAVRHKGFIPWDDDFDICMKASDIDYVINNLDSDLIKIVNHKTDSGYDQPFPRIVHKKSYSINGRVKSYGINIDLYTMIPVTSDDKIMESQIASGMKLFRNYSNALIWRNRAQRYLHLKSIPFFHKRLCEFVDYLHVAVHNEDGNNFFFIASPLNRYKVDVYTENFFLDVIDMDFNNHIYMAPKNYDLFLRQQYGNYMQLPPEENRVPYHGGKYYHC